MSYAANTWAVFAWCVLTLCATIVSFLLSLAGLLRFRREMASRTQHGSRGHPLLLRCMWMASNATAMLYCVSCTILPLLYVDAGLDMNPWSRASLSLDGFSAASKGCVALVKFNSFSYTITKMFCNFFFFIKQRTVRPLSAPTMLEKAVFVMTLGYGVNALVLTTMTQGDHNDLDGTCQISIPSYMLFVNTVTDAGISALYLYLFIQPLVETMRANEAALRSSSAYSVAAAATATTATIPNRSAETQDPTRPQATSINAALEAVMKKNFITCILTMSISTSCLTFISVAQLVDDPYMRKWSTAAGCVDMLVTAVSLTHLMHRKSKRIADGSRGSSVTPIDAAGNDLTVAHSGKTLGARKYTATPIETDAPSTNGGQATTTIATHTITARLSVGPSSVLRPGLSPASGPAKPPLHGRPPLTCNEAGVLIPSAVPSRGHAFVALSPSMASASSPLSPISPVMAVRSIIASTNAASESDTAHASVDEERSLINQPSAAELATADTIPNEVA